MFASIISRSNTAFYQYNTIIFLYCLRQNRNLFEMIDFLLRLYTPAKRNEEKNIEEEIERI